MEPVQSFISLVTEQGDAVLDDLILFALHSSDPAAAKAADRCRSALERFKRSVRYKQAFKGECTDEALFADKYRGSFSLSIREYVFPILFQLHYLRNIASSEESLSSLGKWLDSPWSSPAMLTAYAQFVLVGEKVDLLQALQAQESGTCAFNFQWSAPAELKISVHRGEDWHGLRWHAPNVRTVEVALQAVENLVAEVRAAVGLVNGSNFPVSEKLLTTTPPYLQGDEALDTYKRLLQHAFRENSDGGAAGYYRRGGTTSLVDVDGPDDERLYSVDSFETVIVDGDSPNGRWSYAYHPLTKRGLFSVMETTD